MNTSGQQSECQRAKRRCLRTWDKIKSTSFAASTFNLPLTEPYTSAKEEPFHSVSHKASIAQDERWRGPASLCNNLMHALTLSEKLFLQCAHLQPNQAGTTHIISCCVQTQKFKACTSDVHKTLLVGACVKLAQPTGFWIVEVQGEEIKLLTKGTFFCNPKDNCVYEARTET